MEIHSFLVAGLFTSHETMNCPSGVEAFTHIIIHHSNYRQGPPVTDQKAHAAVDAVAGPLTIKLSFRFPPVPKRTTSLEFAFSSVLKESLGLGLTPTP
jgi:hypothetical protein